MKGVRLVGLSSHADHRGRLIAVDPNDLPFDIKHVFFIHDVPETAVRGEHASSSDEALLVIQGSLVVDLDNGNDRMTVRLSRPDEALCISAGVYLRLRDFLPGTILLALASRHFSDWSRFDGPQPQLLGDESSELET